MVKRGRPRKISSNKADSKIIHEQIKSQKRNTPPGDIIMPYAGDPNKIKIKESAGEPIVPILTLNKLGDKLEPGIYQVKAGYWIEIVALHGSGDHVGVGYKKGHLGQGGIIAWGLEVRGSHENIYNFIKNNQAEQPKADSVKNIRR